MAYPSLTKTFHKAAYPAISPARPELSLKGKTVVISGGGTGIGSAITQAFADAGAARIAILGRRPNVLEEMKQQVENSTDGKVTVSTHATDVSDLASVQKAAREIGKWDVLISNAGYLPDIKHLVDSDPTDWWKAFEINVRGPFNLAHAFLPLRNADATLIGVSAGSIQVPFLAENWTAYNSSKFAAVKMLQDLASEVQDLHVVSMHPGVVESAMSEKSFAGKAQAPQYDTVELPAHFAVWLCSQEAGFLRGKFAWCNWDVEELIAKKDELQGSLVATANCIGWPYAP
ncbi:hypothetical protein LTR78_001718 [Recurvomyces mirabilis]|uniref:NAD(P)-binding protein n=1 Tax=Recurvomyces mirabilis TaxID=574656 RepID=A0AAE0WV70_9PEZI|nr:hypothetical protein LTR78_001718 [Recurvomyces mirabilis]KAK5150207.1 hypothetical protein LTS14_010336 [Recurvomyces mirabilis]